MVMGLIRISSIVLRPPKKKTTMRAIGVLMGDIMSLQLQTPSETVFGVVFWGLFTHSQRVRLEH